SEIKAAALHGFWEYDLSNCHYSILLQLAQRVGVDLPEVRWYLENKRALREALAARIGTEDLDAVKTCLISGPLYGAHSRLSERAAIQQLLGRESARRLFADPQYRALKRDVFGRETGSFGRPAWSKIGCSTPWAHRSRCKIPSAVAPASRSAGPLRRYCHTC